MRGGVPTITSSSKRVSSAHGIGRYCTLRTGFEALEGKPALAQRGGQRHARCIADPPRGNALLPCSAHEPSSDTHPARAQRAQRCGGNKQGVALALTQPTDENGAAKEGARGEHHPCRGHQPPILQPHPRHLVVLIDL